MFMLIVFLSILSILSNLSIPSTPNSLTIQSILNTQSLSARKITTFFRYTQIFPAFCNFHLSNSIMLSQRWRGFLSRGRVE